jgi:hypothetical protein
MNADSEFDFDTAVDAIAGTQGTEGNEAPEATETVATETEAPVETEVASIEVPKSWAKEMHEHWGKMPRQAQEYYIQREKQMLDGLEQYKGDAGLARQFKEVLTPYKPMLTAMGVSEHEAIKYLLNAQYRLTSGSEQERRAAYDQIGRDLGFVATEPDADPAMAALHKEIAGIKSTLTARQQAEQREARAKADREIEAFASDPANALFQEVHQDMVPWINAGFSLKDAYDRAVWGNPVTRAKEQARLQTEAKPKLEEKARAEAEKARAAAAPNLKAKESESAPTDPKGSMEDTMRQTLANIKRRA